MNHKGKLQMMNLKNPHIFSLWFKSLVRSYPLTFHDFTMLVIQFMIQHKL